MSGRASAPSWAEIDPYIAAFEAARLRGDHVELSRHLPGSTHPHFVAILCELVRVDLEFGWSTGQPRPLAEYFEEFPALAADEERRAQAAFEEYRLRQQAGDAPRPEEYARRFSVDTSGWPPPPPGTNGVGSTLNGRAERRAAPTVTTPSAPGPDPVPNSAPDGASIADRITQVLAALHEPRIEVPGFRVLRELGRGAFGRVYLARQEDLANRDVVLKLSADLRGEPQTLARLQHTNIVPIYSVHRVGPLHAFCMPYFGATTFATLIERLRGLPALPTDGAWLTAQLASEPNRPARLRRELEGRSYVAAVLWLAGRLAEGLAYAHDSGVIHQDLKPANVLLSDDGEPMLLDFNLARDPVLASTVPAAYIGGTLPYMSPERLAAFAIGRQHTDPRDDLYALGLILHELLTGRPPATVPTGCDVAGAVHHLTEARRLPVADPRERNPAIGPAVAAILNRCLAPDPAQRYQSAREMAEDITRHLADRPLRYALNTSFRERVTKWRRRNPRLVSVYTAIVVAVALLGAVGGVALWQKRELVRSESTNNLRAFRAELADSRLLLRSPAPQKSDVEMGLSVARSAAKRYGFDEHSDPDQVLTAVRLDPHEKDTLREELAELALLLSQGEGFLGHLTADHTTRCEHFERAVRFTERAERFSGDDGVKGFSRRQRADLLVELGRVDEARTLRASSPPSSPHDAKNLRTLAGELMTKGDFPAAVVLLKQANRADPQNPLGLMLLGYCYERQKLFPRAVGCYDAVLALAPQSHMAYCRRAAAQAESGDHAAAIEDFSAALRARPEYPPALLDRARSHAAVGNHRAAIADLDRVLEAADAPTEAYLLRARFRAILGDRTGAVADRKEGLAREPNDERSWLARGAARLPADPKGALADFERALRVNPRSLAALENRASVLSENLGRSKEAIESLDAALQIDPKYVPALLGRAVLRARAGLRTEAHKDVKVALELSSAPPDQYQAACVYALSSAKVEGDRAEAIYLLESALRGGYSAGELASDHDLDPLRTTREFRELVKKYGSAKAKRD